MPDNYTVPFGIDSSKFFNDINQMDAGLDKLSAGAADAASNMQKAFNATAQSSDKLGASLDANTSAVQILRDQAAKAGADIANSLSGKGIDTAFSTRVAAIKKQLQTLATTTIDLNVDFPDAKIQVLEEQIKAATSATEQFNTVIQFAKDQLATMTPGGQSFITLSTQIQTAEEFLQSLNTAIAQTVPTAAELSEQFNRIFGDPGQFLSQKELLALDEALSTTNSDAEALTAQVTALSNKLATLKPDNAQFEQFTTAVQAGNEALQAMGASVVQTAGAEDNATASTVSYRTQLRNIREELANLYAAGLQNSQEFQDLTAKAAQVGNAFANASTAIKNLSANDVYLRAGTEAMTGLVGAFTAAQGAAALFGGENKKTQETIAKVTGALAVLQGVQAIANALQKDSALTILLTKSARQADTVAAVEETVAVEGEAEATVAATAATEGFTLALLANPLTLIVAAIALAIAGLVEYISKTDDATDAINKENIALKVQKESYDDQLNAIQKSTDLQVAQAQQAGAKQSEIQARTIFGLQQELKARQDNVKQVGAQLDEIQKLADASPDNKDLGKQLIDVGEQYKKALDDVFNATHDLEVKGIEQHTEITKEHEEVDAAFLAEMQSNYAARKAIISATQGFIKDAHKEEQDELTQNNDKQLLKIKQDAQDRIDVVNSSIQDMKQKVKENNAQISLIGEQVGTGNIDPAVGAKQIADLRAQNNLIATEEKRAGDDIVAIKNNTGLQIFQAQKEFAQKQLDLQLSANLLFAQNTEAGFQHDQDVLKAQFEQRNQTIIQQFANRKDLIGHLLASNTAAYADALLKLIEANREKVLDQQSQLDQLQLQNSGQFALDSTKQQEQLQVQLLEIQIKYAKLKLDGMVDDGTKESEVAIAQQKLLIANLQNGLKQATVKAGTVDIFDVLGLGSLSDDSKKALSDALSAVTKGLGQILTAVTDGYKAQIQAKQTLIDADTAALNTLTNQLQTEQDLRAKGLANNVAGIQAQINAKNQQIATEKAQQTKLIKQNQDAQRAQAEINAAIEAGNLIVAASNIFKSLSAIPYVGVALAIASVAAMTAGYIAAQVGIFKAINAQNSGSQFEGGGWIEGQPHSRGGQKYRSVDGGGGLLELEGSEFVVRKSVAAKNANFLEALNDGQLTEDDLREFLHGSGVSLSVDAPLKAIGDVKVLDAAKVGYFHTMQNNNFSADDISALREGVEYMVNLKKTEPKRWEDANYYYSQLGNTISKTAKK
jgi:hypothetical protein